MSTVVYPGADRERWNGCLRKVDYPNEHMAARAAARARERTRQAIYPYTCRFGSHWHIGHTERGDD